MNVIFLDFDGVLISFHDNTSEKIEKRIILLSEICKEYDCKVVLEAAVKNTIDEDSMVSSFEWVNNILDLLKKHNIDCIGITPCIGKKRVFNTPIWKEDEIIMYLKKHPEIDHFCIIDDDDRIHISDLDKVRDYLVKPVFISDNYEEEGLLSCHKEAVGKVLSKVNKFKQK